MKIELTKEEDVKKTIPDIEISEKKPESLTEKIDYVMQNLDLISQKKKATNEKLFKLPFGMSSKLKNLSKQNKALVFYLRESGDIKPIIATITPNGFIFIGNKPYEMSLLFRFLWQGKFPAVIIKEWDVTPIGTKDYDETYKDGRSSSAYAKIIQLVESGELKGGMQMSSKKIFLVFIAAIIIGYILFNKG